MSTVMGGSHTGTPIEMIVPIAPGGGMDLQARLLAELVQARAWVG